MGTVEAEAKALAKVKAEIFRKKALEPFDSALMTKTYLTWDASEIGMDAVIEQEAIGKSLTERCSVFYWSSTFRVCEKNYSIGEKETLACVSAISKFIIYLLGGTSC